VRSGRSPGREYYRFISASLASNLGDGISLVVYPWLAAILTRDPVLIGLTLAIWRAPWLLFSLPMGVLLDRTNRFDAMVRANVVRAALAVLVAVLFSVGLMDVWLFYACVFLLGSCTVLYQLAAETAVPSLVDGKRLEQAYGSLWSFELLASQFGGPLLAGLLIGGLLFVPLTASAAATAVAALLLSWVSRSASPPGATTADRAGAGRRAARMSRQVKEALVHLGRDRRLRALALTLAVLNPVVAMVQATFLLYVQEVLSGGSLTYGALVAAGGVGGIAGGLCAKRLTERLSIGAILCSFFYIAAVVHVGIALVAAPVVVGALNFAFNFTVIVWNVVARSSRQRIMSDEMRGRVTSAMRFLSWGLVPAGFLAGGVVVKALEPVVGRDWALRAPMLAGAALFVLIGLVAGRTLTTKYMTAPDEKAARPAAMARRP
jgi:MFS family permease